jgi:hypothetical protein
VWNYCKGNRILIIIKIFGRHKLVPTLRSGKVWQIWCFSMFLSILLLATAISKFDTFSLYHMYVHESRRWQTFSLFALSELVCTKIICYPILLFPLLSHPKLLLFWGVTDRRTDFNTPCYLHYFLFSTKRAGPYPQAQLYWAGRTMGWMADWTSLIRVLRSCWSCFKLM